MGEDAPTASLQKRIDQDLLAAMKQKDAAAVKVLRFLKSFVDRAAKEKKADLTDAEVVKVIQKRVKQSQDAQTQYQQGGRNDLAQAEQYEIKLIGRYLPTALTEEELVAHVQRTVAQLEATSPKDFGRVMGRVVAEVAGRAEGATIKRVVEQVLGKVGA